MNIINFKSDDGYEVIINMDNVTHIERQYDSPGYQMHFISGAIKILTWKEFDKFEKALQHLVE